MRAALLAIAVGLVLADSSVVTLGLPAVLGEFDSTPESVAWVLTGYNLVLALAAVPAALLLRARQASGLFVAGLVVFAAASLACTLAPSLGFLVFARCVQGLGGAAVACAALPLLVAALDDRGRAAVVWGAAGAIGAAVGPAAGGALTELLSWEAIFAVQVPLALACLAAARGDSAWEAPEAGAPDWPALAALAFLGAGLTAALFLPVLLLIAGWRLSPLEAAAVVSVTPAAALAAGLAGRSLNERSRGVAGAILCAGGLAALGFLPGSSVGWLIPPQVLIGLGLGLALGAVTEEALRDRRPLALHGGWTIAARHVGVVAALAILTPIFTADLEDQTEQAQEIVLARILDSPIAPDTKLGLGLGLAGELRAAESEVPDVDPAFERAAPENEDRPAFDALRAEVVDQLDRAASGAFSTSFLVSALLAALAALPLLVGATRALVPAVAAAGALVAAYLALGGGGNDVDRPPDPCGRTASSERSGVLGTAERVGINALNGAACELGVSRERLVLVLAKEVDPPPGLSEEERSDAFRTGLRRAVDEEERAGRLGGTEALILRGAIEIAPVDALLERVFGGA